MLRNYPLCVESMRPDFVAVLSNDIIGVKWFSNFS